MSVHLGTHLGKAGVCAALVRRGHVLWKEYTPIADGELLDETMQRALAHVPWPWRTSRRVAVVCDVSLCRVRELEGLPAVTSRDLLTDVVRANADAFFPRIPGGLVIPAVWAVPDGRMFGAAMSKALVHDLACAARAAGCSLESVAPSKRNLEAAINANIATESILAHEDGTLAANDASYADAIAAAAQRTRAPLAWSVVPPFRLRRLFNRVACTLAVAVTLASVLAAVAAPALRAAVDLRHVGQAATRSPVQARRSANFAAAEREMTRVDVELRRGRAALDGIAQLRTRHRAAIRLLVDFARALPESTAVVALHVDSLEVRFVALAPNVLNVTPALVGVPGVADARITGSVTRDAANGTSYERAAIRFHRTPTIHGRKQ